MIIALNKGYISYSYRKSNRLNTNNKRVAIKKVLMLIIMINRRPLVLIDLADYRFRFRKKTEKRAQEIKSQRLKGFKYRKNI